MVMFTWDYHDVKVLITSLYHSAIIATSSTISLTSAQIRICQLPVTNVPDGTKKKDCNRNSLMKCVNYVQNRERNFKQNAFSRECPAIVKAIAFFIRKTDLDGGKNY